MTDRREEQLYRGIQVAVDERVTPFIGYCPHCPVHEGLRTHERLLELTRVSRQCPRCGRIYIVGEEPCLSPETDG